MDPARRRDKFIQTTRMLVDLEMEEGSQLYGERFRSMHFLQNMHINKAAQKDCDLWHDGPAFAITHVGFTLVFEQSLQSIDPSITVPVSLRPPPSRVVHGEACR